MKRILGNLGLFAISSALLVGCSGANVSNQMQPTPSPESPKELTAFETVMARKEVAQFIKANKNDLMIWSQTNEDGTVQVEFHYVGAGTTPLWNYYVVNQDNQIVDAWIVFDDEGNAVCTQATEPDTCSVELLSDEL